MTTQKVWCHSLEAEQAVLGGLLLDEAAWDRVADVLMDSDFGSKRHRILFRAIRQLIENRQPVDAITVSEFLRNQQCLDSVGGMPYIGQLANNTPSAANVKVYAQIVRDKAMLRMLVEKLQGIIDACRAPGLDRVDELVARAEAEILSIRSREYRDVVWLDQALDQAILLLDERCQRGGDIAGLSTGFQDLDTATSGFEAGDLVIVAGRPSMGKTALGINIAENVASTAGVVAVFSLEMAQLQVALRILAAHAKVPMHLMRSGKLNSEHWRAIAEARSRLQAVRIVLDDTPAVSCGHIAARCRRIKREHGLALVVVDYLQLMQGSGDSREQEVASNSRGLKAIAKELAVPLICLAQINRRVEDRPNRRPVLSDLRESRAVEQDADIVIFVYRDEVYNPNSEARGTAELLIRKQRNGPLDDIRLTYLDELMSFKNYTGKPIAGSKPKAAGFHAPDETFT